MVIDEIEGITIMVSDQQRALDFYTEKLGFTKKVDTDVAKFRWIVVGPKDSNTVISNGFKVQPMMQYHTRTLCRIHLT